MTEKEQNTLSHLTDIIDRITSGILPAADACKEVEPCGNEAIDRLADKVSTLQKQYNSGYSFIMSLAQGKLETDPPVGNPLISPYKQLQSELRYLAWQIHEIADGDYNQRVSFSGDFSTAFNKMIPALRERERLSELLKESNQTKDRLFSIIAHDLKNPFHTLIGMSDLLTQEATGSDNTIQELARIIHEAASSGYALLTNLLEWSRLQSGRITATPTPFDLSTLILGNIQLAKASANAKEIDLRYTDNNKYPIVSDSNLMNTILRNLISNAIKYTYPKGKIEVTVQRTEQGYQIAVKDNGVGIQEERLPQFFRMDTLKSTQGTRNEKGTGLGLVLCGDFAKKIGGSMRVESTYGEGSTFILSIPNMAPTK